MNKRQDRYSGNILLYNYLSRNRAPILLHRNLTRALQIHRHLLGRFNPEESIKDSHDFRSVWKPPTWDALDAMVDSDRSKGCFVLDIHNIKPLSGCQQHDVAKPSTKARVLLQAKGNIGGAVYSPMADAPCMSIPTQNVSLQSTGRQTNKSVAVDTERIALDPKCFVYPDFLQTDTNDAFKLRIYITMDTKDAEDLWRHLGTELTGTHDPVNRLFATWDNILKCPEEKVVLPLKGTFGHGIDTLGFGIEVTMFWNSVTGESILATYNRHVRAQQPEIISVTQLRPKALEPRLKLVFIYLNKTDIKFGLLCPHDSCQWRKFTDINELRMHLDSWHDYFKYQATHKGLDDQGNETWEFTSDNTDQRAHKADQRASAKADEPFDVRVIAPLQPFDERVYLDDGDDVYQRQARVNKHHAAPRIGLTEPLNVPGPQRRKHPDEVQDMSAQHKRRYPVPQAPPGVTFFRSVSKRPLETGESISESDDEMDDSWIKLRKSAEHTKNKILPDRTKRFLQMFDDHMWEEHMQSDIHAGDSIVRFTRKNRHWIWKKDLFFPFRDKLNELLQDSIVSEEVHTRCLEIVEAAKPDHTGEEHEISQQFADLAVRQSSHDDLYEDPPSPRNRRLRKPDPQADSTRNRTNNASKPKKVDKGKGKAKITDTGHLTPITVGSDVDSDMQEATLNTEILHTPEGDVSTLYDLCLCGQDAQASTRRSPLISCSSMDCVRRYFHYDCIKGRWNITRDVHTLRKSAWVCEDCKP